MRKLILTVMFGLFFGIQSMANDGVNLGSFDANGDEAPLSSTDEAINFAILGGCGQGCAESADCPDTCQRCKPNRDGVNVCVR